MTDTFIDMATSALTGGALIGFSALLLMFSLGKIAGISGMVSALLFQKKQFVNSWQIYFILGLVLGSFMVTNLVGLEFQIREGFSIPLLITSGLLVGYGTQLSNGCTSGHGICGISRLSVRSIVATMVFMASAIATVSLMNIG